MKRRRLERLWWFALAALAVAFGLELVFGATNLTVAVAFLACGLAIIAALVDEPPRDHRRRPW